MAKIPAKVFANCSNQSNIADAEGPSIRLSPEELPVAGDEVGIDAEFVTISEVAPSLHLYDHSLVIISVR